MGQSARHRSGRRLPDRGVRLHHRRHPPRRRGAAGRLRGTDVYRVTTEIHFAYGHRLMNYEGKCAHPHGHNARVEVELETSTLDTADIAVDFSTLKHAIQDWVDVHVDHKMVLRNDDPLLPVLQEMNEPVYVM